MPGRARPSGGWINVQRRKIVAHFQVRPQTHKPPLFRWNIERISVDASFSQLEPVQTGTRTKPGPSPAGGNKRTAAAIYPGQWLCRCGALC
jgi:hypothetical protein